jgi:phosphoribosyl 1,2-cyclic phosphodiesterase
MKKPVHCWSDLKASCPDLMTGFQVAGLGSGSKGNATLIRSADTLLLVDCGFSLTQTRKRLARLGMTLDDLDAVLLTHEHSDHAAGVPAVCRAADIPLYATFGSAAKLGLEGVQLELIRGDKSFNVGEISVNPVVVPHDAREPVQFVFKAYDRHLGLLTDLGTITPHVQQAYAPCDALVLECNHERQMLQTGSYPPSLKRRVGGNWGHLSNCQVAAYLRSQLPRRWQHLVVAHVSEQNNSIDAVTNMLGEFTDCIDNLTIADQKEGFDWHVLV